MLRKVWETWKRIAHKIGNFQARVLLTILYAILVFPFGIAVRVFSDPLHIKRRPSEWFNYPDETCDMGWARRQ